MQSTKQKVAKRPSIHTVSKALNVKQLRSAEKLAERLYKIIEEDIPLLTMDYPQMVGILATLHGVIVLQKETLVRLNALLIKTG